MSLIIRKQSIFNKIYPEWKFSATEKWPSLQLLIHHQKKKQFHVNKIFFLESKIMYFNITWIGNYVHHFIFYLVIYLSIAFLYIKIIYYDFLFYISICGKMPMTLNVRIAIPLRLHNKYQKLGKKINKCYFQI